MKIAVLGAGSMGEFHAQAYRDMPDVDVAAIYGRSHERASRLAEDVGTVATTDLRVILDDPTIDAVDVCVPSPVHHEFVVPALEAGKHVFCETPFALTLENAEQMLAAAKRADRLLLVGLLNRSISHYRYVKESLDSGELGKPLAIYASRLGSYLRPDGSDHKDHYGDPTTELMTFDYDFLNWTLGLPSSVHATAASLEDGRPGHVLATLQYPDLVAVVEGSGVMPPSFNYTIQLRVVGDKHAMVLTTTFLGDGPPTAVLQSYPADGQPAVVDVADTDPYADECRYFIECIQGKADPALLSAERAIEALRISIATQQSLELGTSAKV